MKGISNGGHYSEGKKRLFNLMRKLLQFHFRFALPRNVLEAGARSSNAGWRSAKSWGNLSLYQTKIPNKRTCYTKYTFTFLFFILLTSLRMHKYLIIYYITVKLLSEFLRSIYAMEMIQRKSTMVVYYFWLTSDICPICQPYWDCQIV